MVLSAMQLYMHGKKSVFVNFEYIITITGQFESNTFIWKGNASCYSTHETVHCEIGWKAIELHCQL